MENKLKNRFKRVYLKAGLLLTENIWVLLIFLFLFATRNYFAPLFFNSFIGSILGSFEENSIITTSFFLIIGMSIVIWGYKLSSNSYHIPFKTVLISFGISIFYLVFRINPNIFSEYSMYFTLSIIPYVTYADIFLLSASFGLLIALIRGYQLRNIRRIHREEYIKEKVSFSSDKHIEKNEEDRLEYKEIAKRIVKRILALEKSNHSFTFGITGPWGIGKSSLLSLIEEQLKELKSTNKTDHILISFSPMLLTNSNTLTIEFLNQLKSQLSKFSFRGDAEMSAYIYFLTRKVNDFWSGFLALFSGDKSSQEQLVDIGKLIKTIDRRIIVLIDDLDRLEKEEIIEVLRLMRNVANLPNLVYVVALDKGYVIQKLDNTGFQLSISHQSNKKSEDTPRNASKGSFQKESNQQQLIQRISNAERFLEKFFNVEIRIPSITPKLIRNELIDEAGVTVPNIKPTLMQLYGDFRGEIKSNKEIGYSRSFVGFFDHCLKTKRDIIRYLNYLQLIPQSRLIQEDFMLDKILILELIRLKYYNLYNALEKKRVLFDELSSNKTMLDENQIDVFLDKHYPADKEVLFQVLKVLFDSNIDPKQEPISLGNKDRFYLYFNYYEKLFVSSTEFNNLRKSSSSNKIFPKKWSAFAKKVNNDGNSAKQVASYLSEINHFVTLDEFKNTIHMMIDTDEFAALYKDRIIYHIISYYNSNRYNGQKIKYFISNLLRNKISLGAHYDLYVLILQYVDETNNPEFPLKIKTLKKICLDRLKKFVESNEQNLEKVNNLYFACRDKVENNIVILQEKAHPLRLIYVRKHPWEFISSLIRPYGVPIHIKSYNSFTIDPFTEDTFGSWAKLWEFIDNFQKTDEYNKNKVRFEKYYLFLKDFDKNGYKPFQVKPEDLNKYGIDELIEENEWMVVD